MIKKLYFVRHGETDYNRQRIVQGRGVNSDLNDTGRNQAQALCDYYSHIAFDHLYCSALKRSYQTIEPLITTKDLPYSATPLIDEISWGDHEGKPGTAEMKQAYKEMVKDWSAGNYDARLSGAESAQELVDRCRAFLQLVEQSDYETIMICTHGRTMRCFMCLLQGLPISEMEDYAVANTGVTLFELKAGVYELKMYNDRSHLSDKQ